MGDPERIVGDVGADPGSESADRLRERVGHGCSSPSNVLCCAYLRIGRQVRRATAMPAPAIAKVARGPIPSDIDAPIGGPITCATRTTVTHISTARPRY